MRWPDALTRRLSPGAEAAVAERMAEAYDASSRGDYAGALEIWGPLAHAGAPRAQNNVGACFAEGLGVGRRAAVAYRLGGCRRPRRTAQLRRALFQGEGVAQDNPRARALYHAAAEQGDGPAQDMLSFILLESLAAPDYRGARRFAELAAAQGIASSMTRLGMIFHNALGVDRNPAQAVSWWRRGAERGDTDGQAMLGAAYHLGAGVKRDPMEAFTWLTRAHAGGSALAAGFLDAVRAGLSTQEIAAGERGATAPLPEPSS
jgi:hypothetical protein